MSVLKKMPVWYWVMLALWACAYVAISLTYQNLRTPIFLAMVLLTGKPLVGLPALLALLAPIIALPLAVRRAKVSTE